MSCEKRKKKPSEKGNKASYISKKLKAIVLKLNSFNVFFKECCLHFQKFAIVSIFIFQNPYVPEHF